MLHRPGRRREGGAALVISLLLLAVLLLLGSGTLTNSRLEIQIARNDEKVKRALVTAEYAMTLGEQKIEQAKHHLDLGFGYREGYYVYSRDRNTRLQWQDLTWDDRDSIDVVTFFATQDDPNPAGLPTRPPLLEDEHEHPRLIFEEKFFKRDSLTIGQGLSRGIWYFNVAAHAGYARWTVAQRPGTTHPRLTYNERYPGTRTVLQSVYAKRYN